MAKPGTTGDQTWLAGASPMPPGLVGGFGDVLIMSHKHIVTMYHCVYIYIHIYIYILYTMIQTDKYWVQCIYIYT